MTTSNRCTEIQGKKPTPLQISMATSNPLYKDSKQLEIVPVQAFKTRTDLLFTALRQEVINICTKSHDTK